MGIDLKHEIKEIAEIAKSCPEEFRLKCFEILLNNAIAHVEFEGDQDAEEGGDSKRRVSPTRNKQSEKELIDWTEHSNPAVFRRDVLKRLHKTRLIEWRDSKCTISPTGLRRVEQNYGNFLAELNAPFGAE